MKRCAIELLACDAEQAQQWLEPRLQALGIGAQQCFMLSLCAVEALNNIARHSEAAARPALLSLHPLPHGRGVRLRLRHRAAPFTPPAQPQQEDLLAEHGRGWPLMRQLLHRISYHHRDGCNQLVMVHYQQTPPTCDLPT